MGTGNLGSHAKRIDNIRRMVEWGEKRFAPQERETTLAFNALVNYAAIDMLMSPRLAREYAQTAWAVLKRGPQKISIFGENSRNGTRATGTATPENASS